MNAIEDFFIELFHGKFQCLRTFLPKRNSFFIKGMLLKTCMNFLVGKQYKVVFHKSLLHRILQVLDLIYTNFYTINAISLGGALYFVTFIDDLPRKILAFALKFKDQVLDVVMHFHIGIEREIARQLKFI